MTIVITHEIELHLNKSTQVNGVINDAVPTFGHHPPKSQCQPIDVKIEGQVVEKHRSIHVKHEIPHPSQ
jgi:hypothetical protein